MSVVCVAAPWTLVDALALVRDIQPRLHAKKWHVALGGGVLNRGESSKDIDLYFLPFSDTETTEDVMPLLFTLWGAGDEIGYGESGIYAAKKKYTVDGRRVDAFVLRRNVPPLLADAVDPHADSTGKLSTRA
jgi:hypothetical protein